MVSKLRIWAIVAASIAAGITLMLMFLPIYTYVNIEIKDLKNHYRTGEEVTFSATISGFARQCADIEVSVVGMNRSDFQYDLYQVTPLCRAEDVRMFFTYDIPPDEKHFTISLNQTGTYKVMISYDELINGVSSLREKEFTVTG